MSRGSWGAALAMAACTSWAAASMLRLKENVSVIWVSPIPLLEVMESTPAIVENCFSRGVGAEEAIASGLRAGLDALFDARIPSQGRAGRVGTHLRGEVLLYVEDFPAFLSRLDRLGGD